MVWMKYLNKNELGNFSRVLCLIWTRLNENYESEKLFPHSLLWTFTQFFVTQEAFYYLLIFICNLCTYYTFCQVSLRHLGPSHKILDLTFHIPAVHLPFIFRFAFQHCLRSIQRLLYCFNVELFLVLSTFSRKFNIFNSFLQGLWGNNCQPHWRTARAGCGDWSRTIWNKEDWWRVCCN